MLLPQVEPQQCFFGGTRDGDCGTTPQKKSQGTPNLRPFLDIAGPSEVPDVEARNLEKTYCVQKLLEEGEKVLQEKMYLR